MESIDRFFAPPGGSYFLLGPRGTGKSSWARAAYPEALWIDLVEPDVLRAFATRPERLRELVEADRGVRTVVIDEVQKVPELLSAVHGLHERRKNLRFVLTGSSARKLRRSATDLLAGRAVLRSLHPFLAAELGNRFRLTRALELGMLPLVHGARDPEETLRTYHALYLKEEVQQEGLVRNLGTFARFLEALSFSHGSVLNVSNVARECQVERKTVESYLTVLEDLLLGERLPSFAKRAARAVVTHPKFYYFDCGVFRSIRPQGPVDRPSELDGLALEGLVYQHLRAWIAYRGGRSTLSFWRTRSGTEVDFVVYGPEGFWAIEVKNAVDVQTRDVRSLAVFREDYPEAETLLLYRGRERRVVDGVMCMPCEEFLLGVDPRHARLTRSTA